MIFLGPPKGTFCFVLGDAELMLNHRGDWAIRLPNVSNVAIHVPAMRRRTCLLALVEVTSAKGAERFTIRVPC